MLASFPASMVNQRSGDLGIPNRFRLNSSRFSGKRGSSGSRDKSKTYAPATSVGQAAGRDVLFSRVFCRRVLDHGCDHVVVTDVPVGRDLPVLAVPGLDAPGARAFVVGARHLDRLEHVLETELLEAVGADVQILETPAHLLASHRLLTELLLCGADPLDPEHSGDQPADVKDVPSLIPFWCHARALVVEVLLQVFVYLELTGRMLKGDGVVSLGAVLGRPHVRLGSRPPHAVHLLTRIA